MHSPVDKPHFKYSPVFASVASMIAEHANLARLSFYNGIVFLGRMTLVVETRHSLMNDSVKISRSPDILTEEIGHKVHYLALNVLESSFAHEAF